MIKPRLFRVRRRWLCEIPHPFDSTQWVIGTGRTMWLAYRNMVSRYAFAMRNV